MKIVVLLKAVPVVGTERLGNDLLTDRAGQLEANGNDEYLLEKALKLADEHGAEVSTLTVGPANGGEAIRKALAMGASKRRARRRRHGARLRYPGDDRDPCRGAGQDGVRPPLHRRGHIRRAGRRRRRGAGSEAQAALPLVRIGDRADCRRRRACAPTERHRLRRPGVADAGCGDGHPAPRARLATPLCAASCRRVPSRSRRGR